MNAADHKWTINAYIYLMDNKCLYLLIYYQFLRMNTAQACLAEHNAHLFSGIILALNCTCMLSVKFGHFVVSEQLCGENSHNHPLCHPISSCDAPGNSNFQ